MAGVSRVPARETAWQEYTSVILPRIWRLRYDLHHIWGILGCELANHLLDALDAGLALLVDAGEDLLLGYPVLTAGITSATTYTGLAGSAAFAAA